MRWRRIASQLGRSVAVWAVSTVTMLALAALLPDFRLQSADGDSVTTIAVAAACGAGAFGILSAVVWPLLVRLLLLVPALVLGLLVFFLNGSLLLLALRVNPSGRGEAAPETAVIVAAVMSAVASATGAALAVRDDEAYRRRLHRLATRGRRAHPPCPTAPGLVCVQLDGVGHDVLTAAVRKGLMPTVARWLAPDENADPAARGIRPAADGVRPGRDEERPAGDGSGPAADGVRPGTDGGRPGEGGTGTPAGDGSRPALDGVRPGRDEERPAGDGSGPAADGVRPGTDGGRPGGGGTGTPAGDGSRPALDGVRPGRDEERPAGDGSGPAADGVRPGTDGGRPGGGGTGTPAGDGSRPALDGVRPGTDEERPAGDGPRPAADGTRPAREGAHTAADATSPAADGPRPAAAADRSPRGPAPALPGHGRIAALRGHEASSALPAQRRATSRFTRRPRGPRPVHAPTHRLTPWRTDWSSQTGASQLGILHGSTFDVPAFRWYEKDRGEVMVCNRPTSAAELQRRAALRTGEDGLLAVDGASRGNLFSGGAGEQALVLSIATRRRGRDNRSRAGYFAYFSDPANAVRTALSFVAEVAREIGQSTRARLRRQRPRVSRGGLYPLVRAFATVVERDVVVAAVMGDMLAGRTAVYADLVAYDEVAHHSGPHGRDAEKVLQRLDRCLALLERVAEHAPRPYRIVVLSDHGQSPGETFRARYGLTLGDLVRAGCGLPVPRRAEQTHSGAEARAAVRAALRRPVEEKGAHRRPARRPEPVVLASGNLGLVSFPDVPHRMTKEEIDSRHPALLTTLANHPGIGFLLVRSERHGGVVLGAHGAEIPLARLDEEPGPLARFGPGAADAVRRTHSFPHTADIMVNSAYDPADGEVLAFEEQIGSHGGLGGAQSRPFLLSPVDLSPPSADGTEPVGAERIHRILRRWLNELNGPQVPLTPAPEEEEQAA
ncbi:phage holin family protein [Streptomyces sp. NPDC038707]|uniref:phage holin family protein n=1 Tax=Streptomyces sp. NPDC038707 TaxID=3154329 RepID=UPI0033FFB256